MNSPEINNNIDELLDKLAKSTKSPKGKYSAKNSFSLLEEKIGFERKHKRLRVYLYASIAAASILFFMLFSYSYHYLKSDTGENNIILAESSSNMKRIVLPDSSIVILSRYSKIKYYEISDKERITELVGKAYFEVSKNKRKPFRVKSKGIIVSVLGTHFCVSAYSKDSIAETTLFEGSIFFRNTNTGKGVLMKPNESVVCNRTSGDITINHIKDVEIYKEEFEGKLFFENKSLYDIAHQLSNYFNITIEVADRNIGNYRLSASFQHNENLYDILNMLSETGEFVYVKKDSNTIELKQRHNEN